MTEVTATGNQPTGQKKEREREKESKHVQLTL